MMKTAEEQAKEILDNSGCDLNYHIGEPQLIGLISDGYKSALESPEVKAMIAALKMVDEKCFLSYPQNMVVINALKPFKP